MNTAFLTLYKVENQAPEIQQRIHIKFTGTPFTETQPEFSINVPSGGEYEFSRNLYAFDVEMFPGNVEFNVNISTQTLTAFNVVCIATYQGGDDTTMVLEAIPPGYPPTSKIRLHFRKHSRQKFIYRDFYTELFEISDCLRKLLMWDKTLSEEPNAYPLFNALKASLQTLYTKLNALSQGQGFEDITYRENDSFENNFYNFLNRLETIQKKLSYEKSYSKLSEFQTAFNDLVTKYNALKSYLNTINIAPCENNLPDDVWGLLDENLRSKLSCICKILALDGQVSLGIQAYINGLKNRLTDTYTKLYDFIDGQKQASTSILSANYLAISVYEDYNPGISFCDKAKDIANFLDWINEHRKSLVDVPPDTVGQFISDISADLRYIYEVVFIELEGMLPGVCKEFDSGLDWKNAVIQSPYLYLQACGADSNDDYSEGIHLRWALLKEIGENHFPKGNLANNGTSYYADYGYNQEDDFVKLKKTPYEDFAIVSINFSNTNPQSISKNVMGIPYRWVFSKTSTTTVTNRNFSNEIHINFYNKVQYDLVRVSIDPSINALGFLKAYNSFIEIEVQGKLMFSWKFEIANQTSASGVLKYEAINISDITQPDSKRITIRKSRSGTTFNESAVGESIHSLRLKFENGSYLSHLHLETYNDFLSTREESSWTDVGEFGLVTSDTLAYERLDDNGSLSINGEWPKFNDNVTVKIQNYKDKWSAANDGLKEAVNTYLDLSKTDTKALTNLPSQDNNDDSVFPVKYLDMLNIASLDYHYARMLGVGHIDVSSATQKYVYIAHYLTHPELIKNRGIDKKQHVFMSLPTDKEDLRLPLQPKIGDLTYGLEGFDECTLSKMQKEGEDGYAKHDDIRFINIYRDKYDYEIPFESFFAQSNEFNIAELALPVFYGIKYKESGGNYFKPDLSNSPEFMDYDNANSQNLVNEVVPLIDSGSKLYTHLEENEGEHSYSIYGINWFSRTTPISVEKDTDETSFGLNRVLPPSTIHAHYIQKEENILFTTEAEQNALEDRNQNNPIADNCQTRVTFNWNHIQQMTYPDVDTVEFFYRDTMPKEVEGKIEKVISVGNGDYDVYSQSFQIISKNTPETITPTLNSGDYSKFIGSNLLCQDGAFKVDSIQSGTNGPLFRIKSETKSENTLNDNGNASTPICVPIIPTKGVLFHILENLGNESNWNKLDRTVTIVKHEKSDQTIHTEIINDVSYEIAGIYAPAYVYADVAGTNYISGLFKIVFLDQILEDHPQKTEGVNWYKGTVRIPDDAGIKHELEVWAIETNVSSPYLTVWAFDSNYDETNVNGYNYNLSIEAGIETAVDVNFHPGYKVYLQAEPTHNFDKTHILSALNITKKDNLIALRAKDSTVSSNLKSRISVPVPFMGLNIKEPVKPLTPSGPSFATRPDIYGKSTYSLDLKIEDIPFALVFYRATEFMILSAIYDATVIIQIYDAIEALESNSFDNNRFNDLANIIFDSQNDSNGKIQFKEYNGYRLPNTFKSKIETDPGTLEDKIAFAINSQFVGLTPNPIVYELIKSTSGLKLTSNRPPVTKDAKGHELSKTSSLFDAHPYVIKYSENNEDFIRFTDYTLDGASVDRYFYIIAEITREQKIGERSDALGPIKMVNAFPAEAPYIQKYESVLANPFLEILAGVKFYINPYISEENVKKIAIYRTLDQKNSNNIGLMDLACTLDFENPTNGFTDNFEDLDFPPFGKDIYYRVVALRKIKNEQEEDEYIPSKPSELAVTKVIDNINPPSPEITKTIGNTSTTPPAFENTLLEWEETCFEGKYTLYKMSDTGFWQLVQTYTFEDTLQHNFLFLSKEDKDGNPIYHRFKVVAENVNGLLSLDEQILVL